MDRPWILLDLTMDEIELAFRVHAARCRQRAQDADLQAWLAGRYVLLAVHAPKKFPRRPDGVRTQPADMSPDQMKQAFKRIAAKRGETDGNC